MIRSSAILVIVVLGLSAMNGSAVSEHDALVGPEKQTSYAINKDRKNNQLPDKFKKAVEPLVIFKEQLEEHLPQRELNTIKQMAFRILLMARRYL